MASPSVNNTSVDIGEEDDTPFVGVGANNHDDDPPATAATVVSAVMEQAKQEESPASSTTTGTSATSLISHISRTMEACNRNSPTNLSSGVESMKSQQRENAINALLRFELQKMESLRSKSCNVSTKEAAILVQSFTTVTSHCISKTQRDLSFFDSALENAMNHGRRQKQKQHHVITTSPAKTKKNNEEISLVELVSRLANSAKSSVQRQRDEIFFLRLLVKELVHQLLGLEQQQQLLYQDQESNSSLVSDNSSALQDKTCFSETKEEDDDIDDDQACVSDSIALSIPNHADTSTELTDRAAQNDSNHILEETQNQSKENYIVVSNKSNNEERCAVKESLDGTQDFNDKENRINVKLGLFENTMSSFSSNTNFKQSSTDDSGFPFDTSFSQQPFEIDEDARTQATNRALVFSDEATSDATDSTIQDSDWGVGNFRIVSITPITPKKLDSTKEKFHDITHSRDEAGIMFRKFPPTKMPFNNRKPIQRRKVVRFAPMATGTTVDHPQNDSSKKVGDVIVNQPTPPEHSNGSNNKDIIDTTKNDNEQIIIPSDDDGDDGIMSNTSNEQDCNNNMLQIIPYFPVHSNSESHPVQEDSVARIMATCTPESLFCSESNNGEEKKIDDSHTIDIFADETGKGLETSLLLHEINKPSVGESIKSLNPNESNEPSKDQEMNEIETKSSEAIDSNNVKPDKDNEAGQGVVGMTVQEGNVATTEKEYDSNSVTNVIEIVDLNNDSVSEAIGSSLNKLDLIATRNDMDTNKIENEIEMPENQNKGIPVSADVIEADGSSNDDISSVQDITERVSELAELDIPLLRHGVSEENETKGDESGISAIALEIVNANCGESDKTQSTGAKNSELLQDDATKPSDMCSIVPDNTDIALKQVIGNDDDCHDIKANMAAEASKNHKKCSEFLEARSKIDHWLLGNKRAEEFINPKSVIGTRLVENNSSLVASEESKPSLIQTEEENNDEETNESPLVVDEHTSETKESILRPEGPTGNEAETSSMKDVPTTTYEVPADNVAAAETTDYAKPPIACSDGVMNDENPCDVDETEPFLGPIHLQRQIKVQPSDTISELTEEDNHMFIEHPSKIQTSPAHNYQNHQHTPRHNNRISKIVEMFETSSSTRDRTRSVVSKDAVNVDKGDMDAVTSHRDCDNPGNCTESQDMRLSNPQDNPHAELVDTTSNLQTVGNRSVFRLDHIEKIGLFLKMKQKMRRMRHNSGDKGDSQPITPRRPPTRRKSSFRGIEFNEEDTTVEV